MLLVWGAFCGAAACSSSVTSSAPIGHGDHLIVDVEASTLPPQPKDATPDPTFAGVDGSSIYGSVSGSYVVLSICKPSDGGDSAEGAAPAPADDAASSPSDAAVLYGADAASVSGCMPFPAACADPPAGEPDCQCLLITLASQIPCVASCAVTKQGYSVYCPP